jgi:tRNA dimethylallyltransferase
LNLAKRINKPRVLCLAGPTASGKSALAESLCEGLNVELISVDSALIYRGLNIGSAKPEAATIAHCHYHLLDLLEPEQQYSAAEFVQDAQNAIRAVLSRGRLPILVGGTMLYFRALLQGLSALPATDPALRAEFLAQLRSRGLPAMHAELARVDPVAAARIHSNDPQRTLRALEVFHMTGIAMSVQQTAWKTAQSQPEWDFCCHAIVPSDRAALHQRIAERFDQMLNAGFLDEVRALMRRPGLSLEHSAMRAVGYRQAWEHLRGDFDLQSLRERAIAATRQLAKRQFTWLRGDTQWQVLPEDAVTQRAQMFKLYAPT